MRLASEIWVSALIRTAAAAGVFAVVRRRGDDRAGAIWVVVDRRDGRCDLHVPAAQSEVDADDGVTRQFETLLVGAATAEVDARLASEIRFDPDIWVVEIEDRDGRSFIEPPPRDPNAPPPPAWPPRV